MSRRRYDTLDPFDEMIVKMVLQTRGIREMCWMVGIRSSTAVFYRLKRLEALGYIQRGEKHTKKNRRITRQGLDYLSTHGYISREDVEAYLRLFGNG